jgi:hypothetical protein
MKARRYYEAELWCSLRPSADVSLEIRKPRFTDKRFGTLLLDCPVAEAHHSPMT